MTKPFPELRENELDCLVLEVDGNFSPQWTHVMELGENLSQYGQFMMPPYI
jgi:hypothetical protein